MKIDRPELIIQPPLGEVHFLAFDQSEEIIELGYQSALEALSTINLVTPQETPNPSKFN